MKRILPTILLGACVHKGIQPYTSLAINQTNFDRAPDHELCSTFVIKGIEGVFESANLDLNRLQMRISELRITSQDYNSENYLGSNMIPNDRTSFYLPVNPENNFYLNFLLQDLQNGDRIKVIGCSFQEESFLVVALETPDYSVVFNNPRHIIKQR